ncbi:MAG: hypothetical protein GC168_11685 [Candidatus Hydrogenedens sp.]|nr:hypothetical protein [Candidatus Hydrogenedens sp.]
MPGIDTKGLGLFLGLAFGIGVPAQLVLLFTGILSIGEPTLFSLAALILVCLAPGLFALIARTQAPLPEDDASIVWPLPQWPALRIVATIPLVFLAINLLCYAIGWTAPDWSLTPLMSQITPYIEQSNPDFVKSDGMAMMPAAMMVSAFVLAVIMGMTLFAAVALGSEYGWRGYLLPKLLPLGTVAALLLSGLAFVLWYSPLVFYFHLADNGGAQYLFADMVHFVGIGLIFSAVLGGIWLRTRHIGLVALALGSWAAHDMLLWEQLFSSTHRIVEGPFHDIFFTGNWGLVAMAVWLVVACVPGLLVARTKA